MTTIAKAVQSGILEEFMLPPWELRDAVRPLYAAPEFFEWADGTASLVDARRAIGRRLLHEHMEAMFSDFRCAERPGGGDLRRIRPNNFRVWKMHPPGLRIYGWFHRPREFVAITGALETETKTDRTLNDAKRDAVLTFARAHGLAETMLKGDLRAILQA